MNPTNKIIELLEKGDPIPILAENSLIESFNLLLKYEFIDIVDERIILTPKGIEARKLGFEKAFAQINIQEELREFSIDTQKKESKLMNLCFGLCLSLMIFFLAVALIDCEISF